MRDLPDMILGTIDQASQDIVGNPNPSSQFWNGIATRARFCGPAGNTDEVVPWDFAPKQTLPINCTRLELGQSGYGDCKYKTWGAFFAELPEASTADQDECCAWADNGSCTLKCHRGGAAHKPLWPMLEHSGFSRLWLAAQMSVFQWKLAPPSMKYVQQLKTEIGWPPAKKTLLSSFTNPVLGVHVRRGAQHVVMY